jgi:tetratricopeptide (TPR) repeat protein
MRAGEVRKARMVLKRSLATWLELRHADSLAVLEARGRLAEACVLTEEWAEAEQELDLVLNDLRRHGHQDRFLYGVALSNLGLLRQEKGAFKESADLLGQALVVLEKQPYQERTLRALTYYGYALFKAERVEEARAELAKARTRSHLAREKASRCDIVEPPCPGKGKPLRHSRTSLPGKRQAVAT